MKLLMKRQDSVYSLNHVAEAILQYIEEGEPAQEIPSTQYECIREESQPPDCCSEQRCKAINCPFKTFHPSYYTDCVNVHQLRLLEPTPSAQLPQAYPPSDCNECLRFINFNFEGDSETSSVNGRNFILPPVPPQTQNDDFQKQAIKCSLTADCNPSKLDCTWFLSKCPSNSPPWTHISCGACCLSRIR